MQLLWLGTLQDAEQPELLALRTLRPHLAVPAHFAMHRFPTPASGKLRGRRLSDGVEDGQKLRSDIDGTIVEEVVSGNGSVGCWLASRARTLSSM